jgi:hypothetical protein
MMDLKISSSWTTQGDPIFNDGYPSRRHAEERERDGEEEIM